MAAPGITLLVLFAMVYGTIAADPDMLQDFCVADLKSDITLNGFPCKAVADAKAADFFFDGLAKPGNTNNIYDAVVTEAFVTQIPGLNSLGVSMGRVDYAPGGLNPPHTHQHASEMAFVLEGELYVGFYTTDYVLISKTIKKGENFVFPRGLIHFQINNRKVPAILLVFFNSQLPGIQHVAQALFNSTPPTPNNLLAKTFQIGNKEVEFIKHKLSRL